MCVQGVWKQCYRVNMSGNEEITGLLVENIELIINGIRFGAASERVADREESDPALVDALVPEDLDRLTYCTVPDYDVLYCTMTFVPGTSQLELQCQILDTGHIVSHNPNHQTVLSLELEMDVSLQSAISLHLAQVTHTLTGLLCFQLRHCWLAGSASSPIDWVPYNYNHSTIDRSSRAYWSVFVPWRSSHKANDTTDLEHYFARSLGITLLTLGVLVVLLTGSVPLTSSLSDSTITSLRIDL